MKYRIGFAENYYEPKQSAIDRAKEGKAAYFFGLMALIKISTSSQYSS